MGTPPQGRTVRTCRRAVAPALPGYGDRLPRRRIPCAWHEISAKGRGVRNSFPHVRHSPERTLFGHSSGLAVAVRCKSAAAQGPAGDPSDSTLAGGSHDFEEPHAHTGGEALHRLRAGGGETV